MDFTNKVVLVTGASRGIGRAIAGQFAEHHARVAVHYHKNKQAAQDTLENLPGGRHTILQADLADTEAAQYLMQSAVKEMGRVDIVVNNAGIYESHPVMEVSFENWQDAWRRTLATNLMGPANLMFWAAQQMKRQGEGRIVNISSRGAFRGEPEAPAYGASKAGLNALSQSLAKALGPHQIYVYVIAPGFVETDMAASFLNSPDGDTIRNESPLQRVARPDEVARTALFLASPGSEFLTGCIVDVNGASYLRS